MTTPITNEELRAALELAAKATGGPWFTGATPGYLAGNQWADGGARQTDPITLRSPQHTEEVATIWTYALPTQDNAAFIAAARTGWPAAAEALLAARVVLRECLVHVEELEDAWQRGVLSEHDGKGGTRSNRNVEMRLKLRAMLGNAA